MRMTNSQATESTTTIKVKNKRGVIQKISPLGFKKKFGVDYAKQIVFDKSCSSEISDIAASNTILEELIRQAHIAEIYIQTVNEQVGYGVFACAELAAGQMIGEYTGLARRKKDSDCSNAYIFNYTVDSVIDASKRGNSMRFVNHSSRNPNSEQAHPGGWNSACCHRGVAHNRDR